MEKWNGLIDTMKQYYLLVVKSRREKGWNRIVG